MGSFSTWRMLAYLMCVATMAALQIIHNPLRYICSRPHQCHSSGLRKPMKYIHILLLIIHGLKALDTATSYFIGFRLVEAHLTYWKKIMRDNVAVPLDKHSAGLNGYT